MKEEDDVQGHQGRFINTETGGHESHVGQARRAAPQVAALPCWGLGTPSHSLCPVSTWVEGRGLFCVSFSSVTFSSK